MSEDQTGRREKSEGADPGEPIQTDPSPQAVESPAGTARQRRRKRLFPGQWVLGTVILFGGLSVGAPFAEFVGDHSSVYVVSQAAAAIAVMTLIVWFSFLSAYRWRWRVIPLIAVVLLAVLVRIDGVSGELVVRLAWRFAPKPDERLAMPVPPADGAAPVDLSTTTPYDFPQFLGPRRDAAVEGVALARDWDERPPQLVWRREIGAGWPAFAVVNGFAVTMEQRGAKELVTCYEVESGRFRWVHTDEDRFDTRLAGVGPRATPTIVDGRVYTVGALGRLLCLDGSTGELIWQRDLLEEAGTTRDEEARNVAYGRANSPLVLAGMVIVPLGGTEENGCASLAAFDWLSGELRWKGGQQQISYSSPTVAYLAGRPQILIVNEATVSGHDPLSGAVLWEHDWDGNSSQRANVAQAVPVSTDRVLVSKAYFQGAMLLRLTPAGDGAFEAKQVWRDSRVLKTKFANVVTLDGHAYALSDGILECVDLDTGSRMWKDGRYRQGQILRVGRLLLVLSEGGELSLVEASPTEANRVLGRIRVIEDRSKVWNNMALSQRYLLVRNAREAACYELPLEKP